jgi:hypothetical protein
MESTCQNCNGSIAESYCSGCGQKKFKRIDRKYIWDEIQYTILHTNKGFLYSLKNIIKNPGKTARGFIDGNRVNHYKPILLAFILSGISAFISFKIVGLKELTTAYYTAQHINSPFMNDTMSIVYGYNSFIMLLLVPFFAFFTKLAFSTWKHNYYEHVVMNAYILACYNLFNIAFIYPLMLIFKNSVNIMILSSLPMLVTPFILFWFFKEFYVEKPKGEVIGRIAVIIGLMIAAAIVFFILVAVGAFVYAAIKGPEALKYLQAQ